MPDHSSSTSVDFQQISKARSKASWRDHRRRQLAGAQAAVPSPEPECTTADVEQNRERHQRLRDGRQPGQRKHLSEFLRRAEYARAWEPAPRQRRRSPPWATLLADRQHPHQYEGRTIQRTVAIAVQVRIGVPGLKSALPRQVRPGAPTGAPAAAARRRRSTAAPTNRQSRSERRPLRGCARRDLARAPFCLRRGVACSVLSSCAMRDQ